MKKRIVKKWLKKPRNKRLRSKCQNPLIMRLWWETSADDVNKYIESLVRKCEENVFIPKEFLRPINIGIGVRVDFNHLPVVDTNKIYIISVDIADKA